MFHPTNNAERPPERRRMWSGRVLAKYWLLQLPAIILLFLLTLALAQALDWPRWVPWAVLAFWVAVDAVLYPWLWRSYDYGDPGAFPYPVEGARGVAVGRLEPTGQVRIWGELWRAQVSPGTRRIEPGEAVQVKERSGLTLLVEPAGHR